MAKVENFVLLTRAIVVAFESNVERKAMLYLVDTLIAGSKLRLLKEASAEIQDDIRLGAQRNMDFLKPTHDCLPTRQETRLILATKAANEDLGT